MKSLLPILITILGVIILVICQQKVDIEKEQYKLLKTDREFSQMSVEKGAAEAFRFYLVQNALQLPHGSHPIQGGEAIYQRMIKNEDTYELQWEPKKAEVCKSGEMGYTWGVYTTKYIKNGEEQISYGKYLNIWMKQPDNTWKVLIDMGNNSPE